MLKYYFHECLALLLIETSRIVKPQSNRLILVLLPFGDSPSVLFSRRWDAKVLLKPRLISNSSTFCGGSKSYIYFPGKESKFLCFSILHMETTGAGGKEREI